MRIRHYKAIYNDQPIKITGCSPDYTVTWQDGKTVIIKRYADGWYVPESPEQYWTEADAASLGAIIEARAKNG